MSFDTKFFVYPGTRAHVKAIGFRPAAHGAVSWNTVNGSVQYRPHRLLVAREPSRDTPVRPFSGPTLKNAARDLVRTTAKSPDNTDFGAAGLPAELKPSSHRND